MARVQPLVPEVSMLQPCVVETVDSKQAELTIKPLREPFGNLQNKMSHHEISGLKESPSPAAAPSLNSLRPTSEFSKIFVENSLSVLSVPPSKSSPELGKPEAPKVAESEKELPEDVYKVLKWQNDQLMMLQDQVKRLLSSKQEVSSCSKQMSEMSTQTSAPSSPLKKLPSSKPRNGAASIEMADFVDDVSILQINEKHEEVVLEEPRPPTISPLTTCGSDKIVCQDLCPPENIDAIIQEFKESRKTPDKVPENLERKGEPSIFGRLRDMGVSFIRPSDIRVGSRVGEVSTWHPTAAEPSFISTTESTSDYSLMLNSAALKHLDDEQLTHVAKRNSGSSLSCTSSGPLLK